VLARRPQARTLADSVLSLQRSAGNAAVVRLLARQPRDVWAENQPPTFPRQQGDPVGMTGCSIVWKDGAKHVKCETASGRSTPAVPTDPSKIPDMIPKDPQREPLGPLTDRPQGPMLQRPPSLSDICAKYPKAPVCIDFKPEPRRAPDLPVVTRLSYDVLFARNQATPTPDGTATLDLVVSRLENDPSLWVQLIGHASSEGDADQNLQLSIGRAKAIQAGLAGKGLGGRVIDPRDEPAGCTRLEPGVWACGATQAAPGTPRPEDRKVAVSFLRSAGP
jgi:outer membrane protein OmpA-like peptidoglycan-associated protein